MIDETFTASAEKGETEWSRKLSINAKRYFQSRLNKVPIGTKLWVHVFDKEPKRSDRQHRFYWLYLNRIEAETGNDADYLHEHFKREYLALPPKDIMLPDGKTRLVITYRSTTELSKSEFSEYLMKIERDSGVELPDTDEFHFGPREDREDVRDDPNYPELKDMPTI